MLRVFRSILSFIPKTYYWVERKYVNTGSQFGGDVSYLPVGECVGFEAHLNNWASWEREYASKGYRTVSLDDFIEAGGYGKEIDHLLGQKRDEREEPFLHAEEYRRRFLGKVEPVLDLKKVLDEGEILSGTYILPSTKIIAARQNPHYRKETKS